ncbi:hypothetical protein F8M41_016987 [Gigaspora margarita]|uniref:Uncharacterized protein n=1 Tax=Gigaspora margarita TaxID=4874 RepID=A0A8H4EUD1_GIGMA|nr:hypothetical protein F8M41_016987 [Gigaspora margarita]
MVKDEKYIKNFKSENKEPINVQSQIELNAYNLNAGVDLDFFDDAENNEELQKEVLRAMGHQILKVQADDIYFNNNKKNSPYIHELSTYLKEIGNIDECNIFASVLSENDKNVFSLHVDYVNQDKNFPVIVIHNIQSERNSILFKKKGYLTAKLTSAIVGLPASFNFDTQYLLMLKSEINPASGDKSHCTIRINDFGICMLGTCALKAVDNTTQMETVLTNISDSVDTVEIIQCDIQYNPKDTTIAIGAHFTPCRKSACLFVYDINDRKKSVNDPTILQRLTLNTCTININYPYQLCNFGQIKVEWTQGNNSEIYYGNEIKKENEILSDNNLIFVSQVLDDCINENCKYHGFINVNTSKIIYGSLNSEPLDFVGTIGSIAYLSFPSKN